MIDSERRRTVPRKQANEQDGRIQILRPLLPDAGRLLSYLRRIDTNRKYTNWGPLASELEDRLAAHFCVEPGAVTSAASGTSALVGAILGTAGRARPDRPIAIVPAFTFVATALAVEQCGYRPHLVDVDADRWQLQMDAVANHPLLDQVGVVVPVAPFGRAVPQAPWLDFERRTGIPVAIDGGASFEALGQAPAAFVGDVPVALSFHATKSFSTAEGGSVVTTDPRRGIAVSRALNFGFFDDRECRATSTNGKMSEYHAAIGLAGLDGWHDKRMALQEVACAYRRQMEAAGMGDRLLASPDVASCYVLFRAEHRGEAARILRNLESANIECRLWYGRGVHCEPYYAAVSHDDLPVTDRAAVLTIGLPVAPDLPDAAVRRVVDSLVRGVRGCA